MSKSQFVQESSCCCRRVPTRNTRNFTIPSVTHHRQNPLESLLQCSVASPDTALHLNVLLLHM
jgi:hypothetical protein